MVKLNKKKDELTINGFPILSDIRRAEILKVLGEPPDFNNKKKFAAQMELLNRAGRYTKTPVITMTKEEKIDLLKDITSFSITKKGCTDEPIYFSTSDIIDQIDIGEVDIKKKLVWVLQSIQQTKKREDSLSNEPVYIEFSGIIKKPFFVIKTFKDDIESLFTYIKSDKDFFRKYDMRDYNPDYKIDPRKSGDDVIAFYDFTDDLVNSYLKHILSIDNNNQIEIIEVQEDKDECKMIKLYINKDYNNAVHFHRSAYINTFYILARDRVVNYLDGFYTYFNSNRSNPIYKKTKLDPTTILKKEGDIIVPNSKIPIVIRTQKYISQAKNKATNSRLLP